MQVNIAHPDGSKTVYYGVSDVDFTGGELLLWPLSHLESHLPTTMTFEGEVEHTLNEAPFEVDLTIEAMLNHLTTPDTHVVVQANKYHTTAMKAAQYITDNVDDFDGELTILSPKTIDEDENQPIDTDYGEVVA